MKNHLLLIWLVVTCCFLAGCESNGSSDAEHFTPQLEQGLASAVSANNAPGGVLAVRFADGSSMQAASGDATLGQANLAIGADMGSNATPSSPMETTDRFRIGSVTKTFIGTAILLLVKDGLLSLDDTLEAILPGTYSKGSQVTIRQLLDHSSSIPNYTNTAAFVDRYIEDLEHEWTTEELIDLIDDQPLQDVPGREGYYSNTNYLFLGMIIERLSGRNVEEFLQTNIFDPLGLENTYFPTENTIAGNHADGYFDYNEDGRFEADEKATDQSPTASWAAGAIISTPDDLLIWIEELMSGTLLTQELQAERMKLNIPYHGAPAGVYLGLGIADLLGPIGHTGGVAGYTTYLFRYKGVDFVTYSNGYHTTEDGADIAKVIFETAKDIVFDEDE